MQRRYFEIDVFAERPYLGNPLGVVVDAAGLSESAMQQIAAWTNFSETAFLLPPTDDAADYRVRIFTTESELPFAGHPTLGSCRAWLEAGGISSNPDVAIQECGIGLVSVRRSGDALAFRAPPLLRSGPVAESMAAEVAVALGVARHELVDLAWIDNGPGWLGVLLDSAEAVLDLAVPSGARAIGVVGLWPPGGPSAYEVRAFFPGGAGLLEDPVTGSLHAAVAQWLLASGRVVAPLTATQGSAVGRSGIVAVEVDPEGSVWIGGAAELRVAGTIEA